MKKSLSILMVLTMVLTMLPAGLVTASALTSGDYTYTVTDSKATITAYSGTAANVTVPSTLGGYPVTEIGSNAFQFRSALVNLTVPDSVLTIGDSAFYFCTAMAAITIGSGLSSIGSDIFLNDTKLTSITVSDNNNSYSSQGGVLFNKTKTTLVLYPLGLAGDYEIPGSVTALANKAFYQCSSITGVTIPASVVSIGTEVFNQCYKLNKFIVADTNNTFTSQDDVLFNKLKTVLIRCPLAKPGMYTVPDTVTEIGANAFNYCQYLTGVIIQNSVTKINDGAFGSCLSLTGLSIPDSVSFIGENAFASCSKLLNVTLGSGIASIGRGAFSGCGKLAGAYFTGNAPTLSTYVFNACASGFTVLYNIDKTGFTNPWYTYPTAIYGDKVIVSFDAAGGSGAISACMSPGAALTAPTVTRTGFSFTGWSPSVPATAPSVNSTYTAQWTAYTYTVAYNGNGSTGGSTASSTHTYAVAKNLTANGFTKTGYTFSGWATSSGGAVVYTDAQSIINLSPTNGATVTLYAKWTAVNGYTITFDANGGTGGTSTSMPAGAALTAPTVTRTGYTFIGWTPSVPATVPAANTTYTAQWTVNTYTVTYNGNTATAGTTANSTHTYNIAQALTLNGYTKTGYTFLGWATNSFGLPSYNNGQVVTNLTSTNGATVTLYAKWAANTYTVTFDAQGGSVSPATKTVTYAGTYSALPAPSKSGYTFSGWFTGADGTGTQITDSTPVAITSDQTLYACWTADTSIKITFDANGGMGGTSTSMAAGAALTAPQVVRFGYTFIGWSPEVPPTVPEEDATFTAQWAINQYTITFDANGGTGSAQPVTADYGTDVALPATGFNKTGYTFKGWNTQPDSTIAEYYYTVTACDVKLYAIYSINQYTITFNANSGTGTASPVKQDYGTSVTLPTGFAKTGCTFLGWNTTADATTALAGFTVPEGDTTLYAIYSINQYTITFNSIGGSAVSSITGVYNTSVDKPADPTKTGYTFGGWYREVRLTNPVSWPHTLTANVTFHAKWIANQYTVTFDANGGTGSASPVTQNYNTSVTLPSTGFTKTGYTFIGWNTTPDALTTLSSYTVPAGDTTLYAIYTVGQYISITFDPNDGSGFAEPIVAAAGSEITLPATGFTKVGCTFIGWNTDRNAAAGFSTYSAPFSDVTLYAVYRINQYSVYFDANGGTGSAEPVTQDYDSAVTLPATGFTKTGYIFIGWNTATDASTALNSYTVPAYDVTLYAVYSILQYTITFNANGGSTVTAITQNANTAVAKPADPTQTGYTFSGWYSDAGLTAAVTWPYTITGNITFYAKWVVAVTYKISFSSNGGTSVASITQNANTAVEKPADPTKTGYTFKGWYTDSNLTNAVTWPYILTANVRFYAKWSQNSYTVTFDAQGGTVSPSSRVIGFGDSYSPLPTPVKTGYVFMGWYTGPDGTGTRILASNGVAIAQDHTLYAKWIPVNIVTVTLDADGGTVSPGSVTVTTGLTYGDLPTPTKTGKAFAGWYTGINGSGTSISSYTQVTATTDHTLYAKWSNPTYHLVFDSNGGSGGMDYWLPAGSTVTINYFPQYSISIQSSDPYNPIIVPMVILQLPTKQGYTFLGWSCGSGLVMPSYDVTVNAIWSPNAPVIITFDANGGEGGTSGLMDPGDPLDAPIVTRTGYHLIGWSPSVPAAVPSNNATYTAMWAVNSYIVHFNTNGGSPVLPIIADYGTSVAKPTDPVQTGYTFAGWYSDAAMTTAVSWPYTMRASDVTFYAKWSPLAADYSEVTNAWNSRPADTANYTADSVAALEDFYYQEIDWNLTIEYQDIVDSYAAQIYALIDALVLKPADYAAVDNAIKAIPDNDGGLLAVNWTYLYSVYTKDSVDRLKAVVEAVVRGWYITEQQAVDDWAAAIIEAVNALVPLTADYTALGLALEDVPPYPNSYYTAESIADYNNAVAAGQALYNSQNLDITHQQTIDNAAAAINVAFASLAFKAVTYTVKYQTSTGVTLLTQVIKNGQAADLVTENALAVSGYSPVQSSIQKQLTGTNSENVITFTYIAITCTITWNPNGGTGGVTTTTQNPGTTIVLPADPTKTGYMFAGWYFDSALTTPLVMPYTVTADVTFYARWTVNYPIYTFKPNGGTWWDGTTGDKIIGGFGYTIDYGINQIELPGAITRTGYTFAGWSPCIPATLPATDCTFTAQWVINAYTITFDANGGTAVSAITRDYGTSVAKPADPVKAGYTFAGWYSDAGLTNAVAWPYTIGVSNVTFYAKWTASYVHFTVSSASGMTGDIITVSVTVSENSNLGAITLVVPYDPAVLEVVSYSAGSILNGFALDVNNNETALTITLAAAGTTKLTAGGSILDIQFRIKGSAPAGTINTGAYISELTDTATPANALPFDITQGSITVAGKLGDINGSGTVTAVDALMVLQAATGRITLTAEQMLAADVNKSGTVTALDALMILQYATGKLTSFN